MRRCGIYRARLARLARILLAIPTLALAASAQNQTCSSSNVPPRKDFHGQTLKRANFSHRDLTNADFSGATLVAPFFDFANLTNANFRGAVIVNDSSNPALVADFSFANVEGACFLAVQFQGPTYFTNARLTCANFSETDLTAGNAIFGESPLTFDRARTNCRLAFRSSIMDCEFVADWRFLDLSGADVNACLTQLAGRDLSNAKLPSVNLSGANLDNVKFVKADLSQAILDGASLRNADLSYASLLGADLNLANLTGATLYHAFLSNETPSGITNAAQVRQAHLKNVNLSFAQISGVDLTYSNFYGHDPAGTGICKTAASRDKCRDSPSKNYEGFSCDCASAHGAIMTQTKFSRGYLYGVDFTAAVGQGLDFREAVLTGANFSGASIATDPVSGAVSTFFRAFLQGTNLEGAQLKDRPNLSDAFVDFTPHGNNIYIFLDGANHNQFNCPDCTPPTGSNVCVLVNYHEPTKVPSGTPLTCPNGFIGNCGAADPSGTNKNWESKISDIGNPPTGVPPAWYEHNATYTNAPANPNVICNGQGPDKAIVFW
jgi:uncharacterized protein YjbI with pentapeptide repeats